MGRKFEDEEDSPQDILINDLVASKKLFLTLSSIVNDKFKKEISESIETLASLIKYIEDSDNDKIIDLLNHYENSKK